MFLDFIRPTGKSTYKIYELLGIKLVTRLWLGFSHLSEHKFKHNFADSLNPLYSSFTSFFLCCQNYTNLYRALMTK